MKTAVFQLEPLTCPSCVSNIEKVLSRTVGVSQARVLFHASKVKVDYDASVTDANELGKVIDRLGYRVIG